MGRETIMSLNLFVEVWAADSLRFHISHLQINVEGEWCAWHWHFDLQVDITASDSKRLNPTVGVWNLHIIICRDVSIHKQSFPSNFISLFAKEKHGYSFVKVRDLQRFLGHLHVFYCLASFVLGIVWSIWRHQHKGVAIYSYHRSSWCQIRPRNPYCYSIREQWILPHFALIYFKQ